MKKSYYRLALKYHPDRVTSDQKDTAKNKFSIVHQAYDVLCDPNKRKDYDNGNDNVLFVKATKSDEWEHFLKPATNNEIDIARQNYQNSLSEARDIEREYLLGKGSLTHLLNNISFMRVEDESRIIGIIQELVRQEKIPKYKIKKIKKA